MLIFTFALNEQTKEAVFSGNITARQAINILQDILISDEIRKSKEQKQAEETKKVESG
jgi:hypothetical protein